MNNTVISVYQKMEAALRRGSDPENGGKPSTSLVYLGLLAAWLIVVVTVALQHELWRDEVRALSIATGVDSPLDIIKALKDEGHPALWYLILYFGYSISHSVFILQAASIGIAFLTVGLFLFRAPFPLWFKAMFMFGVFPIYEYSVMARNYGISMLLLFAFAAAYGKRRDRPMLIGLLLALLANTNVHSLMLSCLLMAAWLGEVFFTPGGLSFKQHLANCRVGIAVALAGILVSVYTIWPEHSAVQSPVKLSLYQLTSTATLNGLLPGKKFLAILPFSQGAILNSILVWLLALGLSSRLHLSITLLAGFAAVGTFADLVYMVALRHQGVVFAFTLCLYWIARQDSEDQAATRQSGMVWRNSAQLVAVFLIIPALLGCHLYKGYKAVVLDVREQKSSVASLGQFLNSHQELHDAIVIGEPDWALEALPYYASNPIYQPREAKFGKIVKLTTESKPVLSLGELIQSARGLDEKQQKPVLVVLGVSFIDIDDAKSTEVVYGNTHRTFTWSAQELADFRSSTRLVAKLTASHGDEKFMVYQLD